MEEIAETNFARSLCREVRERYKKIER